MNSIGVDFKLKTTNIDNKRVKLQIWDTAGQERFRTITTSYYKGAQAIFVVFDVTDKDSFAHVSGWMNDIDKHAKDGVMRILVGNKTDLDHKREVSEQEARECAKKYGINYVETSAKESTCIDDLFVSTSRSYMQGNQGISQRRLKDSFTEGLNIPDHNKSTKKSGCC